MREISTAFGIGQWPVGVHPICAAEVAACRTEALNEILKLVQRADLMGRRGRCGNAGPEDLDGSHLELIACCNFRVRIVANYQDLLGRKMMVSEDRLEGVELAFRPGLINGIDVQVSEEVGNAEGFDFALLQAAKA